MSKKSYVALSLTMGHLSWYCDLSDYAILSFLYHPIGDTFSVRLIYYTCPLFILKIFLRNNQVRQKKSFDSLAMLEDAIF